MLTKLQNTVLQWYESNGRTLPWRNTQNPYHILVSEIMLQQTQVDRVIPKYEAFLHLFPTIEALARAPTSEVLRAWSGLGYNRRALYLQKCAQELTHEMNFPQSEDELKKLPGIGKYTAAAILSFAYNKDIPVIDINIHLLYKRIFYGSKSHIENLAKKHLPQGKSRVWHNALMDIGALFCSSKSPRCNDCPLTVLCKTAGKKLKIEATRIKKNVIPFAQSDRIVRGNILKLLMKKNYNITTLHKKITEMKIKRNKKKFNEILTQLQKDKLIKKKGKIITLP
ncbi:MAG: A/G-specific adenine glycosylase [Candidatus Woesearchaeota archaeon]|jgi:A/G-specific adenine glycosylase